MTSSTRALVLAGGGVTGIAWEIGVLGALADHGFDIGAADLIVGTSAGSTVGAQITSGAPMADLIARQRVPADQTKERSVDLDFDAMAELFSVAVDLSLPETERMAKVGAMAKAAATISPGERREIIAARLPSVDWPEAALVITAIDCDSGEFRIFDAESGVGLVDAVAASSAVPSVWPPVPIDGHLYMDGGFRSSTNADLADGFGTIVVLSPMAAEMTPQLDRSEIPLLEAAGATVAVLRSDDEARAAMGINALDPAKREPSLDAGWRQGEAAAADMAELWDSASG